MTFWQSWLANGSTQRLSLVTFMMPTFTKGGKNKSISHFSSKKCSLKDVCELPKNEKRQQRHVVKLSAGKMDGTSSIEEAEWRRMNFHHPLRHTLTNYHSCSLCSMMDALLVPLQLTLIWDLLSVSSSWYLRYEYSSSSRSWISTNRQPQPGAFKKEP